MIDRITHAQFFQQELEMLEVEVQAYWNSMTAALFEQRRLFKGAFLGVDETRGNVLIKFRKGNSPRKNMPYLLFTVPADWKEIGLWERSSYRQLREQAQLGSEGQVIFKTVFKDNPENFLTVGFSDLEESFVDNLPPGAFVVVAELDPPVEYLLNLKRFVLDTPKEGRIGELLDLDLSTADKTLSVLKSAEAQKNINTALSSNSMLAIQGPPGTGKTFLIAELCAQMIQSGKSILVVAQSNQALMELALKPQLTELILKGKVLKTRISTNERKRLPKLQLLDRTGSWLTAPYNLHAPNAVCRRAYK
jgi:DNA replication ATP-dependent helicase Dna2